MNKTETIYTTTHGELPIKDALKILDDDYFSDGNGCDQTYLDLVNALRIRVMGETTNE